MFKLTSSITSIGLERTSTGFKGAIVEPRLKGVVIKKVFSLNPEKDNVKLLYIHNPILATGISGLETLVRSLYFPLTKEKDIAAALSFQAEPILPYSVDDSLLAYQILEKMQEATTVALLATRKEALQAHLDEWKALRVIPEKVSCIPWALLQFGSHYFPSINIFLILHIQNSEMTCILIKEKKLIASFALPAGLDLLFSAQKDSVEKPFPHNESEWTSCLENKGDPLAQALIQLQRNLIKMGFALAKELRGGESIEGIAVTGETGNLEGLSQTLVRPLKYPLLKCESIPGYFSQELSDYAVPIGLAIAALPGQSSNVDFRQGDLSYPNPWRRLKIPMFAYLLCVLLLSGSIYLFTKHYIAYQEDLLKNDFVEMLSGMNKSYDQFEESYQAKNPIAKELYQGEIPPIKQLTMEDLQERLTYLQTELQATPDSFPLFPNIPRVSDVLGWLSRHEAVMGKNEQGDPEPRLQIENFSYIMVKRPQQGKKQDKYQIKVELEFTSPTPKWAREFHDALITPNEWVDPKAEVKWSSNRGKYKTSFFLKDRTIYPSS